MTMKKQAISRLKRMVSDQRILSFVFRQVQLRLSGSPTQDEMNGDENGTSKGKKKNSSFQFDEQIISDDDDFPDDQEILKTTNLANLKKSLQGSVREETCISLGIAFIV